MKIEACTVHKYCLNSSWDKYLNVKVKTVKCLEDSIVGYRFFFTPDTKVQTTKELILIKLNYIKTKDF